jgi:hypothetical protein
VPAKKSLAGILELSDNEGFWVNDCAALFHGAESFSVIDLVLDPVQISNP